MRILIAAPAWAITILIALPLCLQAQETIEHYNKKLTSYERASADFSKPINILSDQNGKYTLVFSDVAKGVVTKTIDIRENNPFAKLGEQKSIAVKNIYETKGKILNEVFPAMDYKYYFNTEGITDTDSIRGFRLDFGANYSPNRHFVAVFYSIYSIPHLICRSQVVLFDSIGLEVAKYTVDANCGNVVITNDGKYFAISVGDENGEDITRIHDGFMVFDSRNGNLILWKNDINISGLSVNDNLIIANSNNYKNKEGEDVDFRWFVDVNNKFLYSREFDLLSMKDILVNPDGLTIIKSNNEQTIIYFKDNFTVEELK